MISVKGKWALITGSSRGIGRLSAVFMAQQGCNLILHSRKKEHNIETAEICRKEGAEVYLVEAELSDLEQVERMLKEIDDLGKQVDIILNNAGLQIAYRTDFLTTPAEDYTESFKINTTAPMMICYHFLPGMIKRGFGRILNTTSGIALDPQQAGYSASKAALNKVTIDIGSKVNGTDVMINLTDPGWCRTDLGGPHAPSAPESTIPGIVAGVFADDRKSGRIFGAQSFSGMILNEAVEKIEREFPAPY